ncbi:MFS transporter [Staphylospora marina]|uniref:MFS transporter n=1 Tax=Staphylospora marina TaxID=2490858 RepID=UPI0013DE1BA7|nr:MFS transporter [Staphylospora marina]
MHVLRSNRPFLSIWMAQLLSRMGDGILSVTIIFLIGSASQDPWLVGMVLFAQWGPSVLFGLFAGAIADRVRKHRLMMVADAVRAVLVLVMLVMKDSAEWLILLIFLEGAVTAFYYPARLAYISEIVERERITEAMGIMQSTYYVTMLLGPAIGGLLIASHSVAQVFWIDAASYLGALFFTWLAGRMVPSRNPGRHEPLTAIFGDLSEGFRVFARTDVLRELMLIFCPFMLVAGLFNTNYNALLLQEFRLNGFEFGISEACLALGAVLGALSISRIPRQTPLGRQLMYLLSAFSMIMLLVLPLQLCNGTPFIVPAVCVWSLVCGCFSGLLNAWVMSQLLQLIPLSFRGRGVSLMQAVVNAGMIVGFLAGGWLAGTAGITRILVWTGGFSLLGSILFTRSDMYRKLNALCR